MVDLHAHSTASDGSDSPAELVAKAAAAGLAALALTDHDGMDGIPAARAEAGSRGIRLVAGIEIEIEFSPGEFHLLGLGIEEPTAEFTAAVEGLKAGRRERNVRILGLMAGMGIEASYGELEALAGSELVGRPHIAELLVARKAARNKMDAFSRFLAKGRPLYLPKRCLDLREATRMVGESGGVPLLAHPLSLFLSWGRLLPYLRSLRSTGILGLEAWHPGAKEGACRRLEAFAREEGMLFSAGSDYHGTRRPDRKLGRTAGGRKIEDSYLASAGLV